MAVVTMRDLLEAGVHFGHQTRRWNPKMKRFIHGERNGIYIIDLQQTLARIEAAYSFVRDLVGEGGIVLFVGTKKQAQDPVRSYADKCNMPYINERWLGGMLTNFQTISKRVGKMKDYERMRAAGEFEAMPKKEALDAHAASSTSSSATSVASAISTACPTRSSCSTPRRKTSRSPRPTSSASRSSPWSTPTVIPTSSTSSSPATTTRSAPPRSCRASSATPCSKAASSPRVEVARPRAPPSTDRPTKKPRSRSNRPKPVAKLPSRPPSVRLASPKVSPRRDRAVAEPSPNRPSRGSRRERREPAR